MVLELDIEEPAMVAVVETELDAAEIRDRTLKVAAGHFEHRTIGRAEDIRMNPTKPLGVIGRHNALTIELQILKQADTLAERLLHLLL